MAADEPPAPSLAEMARAFGRIGLLSFGGPAAQIALMHREIVERRGWLSQERFLAGLGLCTLLPGPEAMQLATYAGWRLRGTAGGLLAGLLFTLPGAALIFALACAYAAYGALPDVQAAFLGIKAAVVVVVVEALARLSRRALAGWEARATALLAFAAIYMLHAPVPLVLAAAAAWGALRAAPAPGAPSARAPSGAARASARAALVWGAIWLAPLAALSLTGGILAEIGWLFARIAALSFGGAYAVLAWLAQEAVEARGWLGPGEMIDALGLAETTPGPLILVTQFVAVLAALPAGPLVGLAAGLVALHATFAPCFLWIFVAAPWIDRIAARPRLKSALAGITAAVVGVILNLSLWFALHVLFGETRIADLGPARPLVPVLASAETAPLALVGLAAAALLWLRAPLPATLAICAAGGLALV